MSSQLRSTRVREATRGLRSGAMPRCVKGVARMAAVPIAVLLMAFACNAQAAQPTPSSHTITGTVVENRRDCVRDGACVLVVQVGGERWEVLYHPGEGERRCPRAELAAVGLALQPQDKIRASGRITARGAVNRLDLCSSADDSLVRVTPR
ncbi:MAG: hypothetical protein IT502_15820 [Rubrivivax sp.]|nr:hypothetical protein [Rubrivivax sp.]